MRNAEAAEAEHGGGEAHASTGVELGLMVFSILIAIGGIGFAYRAYITDPAIADRMQERFAGAHRLLLHKYYVDELYDAAIVKPIKVVSQQGLWRGFDVRIIDGAVNGTGALVSGGSAVLRRLQTGSVRTYAGSLFVGVVVVLGYYLWR